MIACLANVVIKYYPVLYVISNAFLFTLFETEFKIRTGLASFSNLKLRALTTYRHILYFL